MHDLHSPKPLSRRQMLAATVSMLVLGAVSPALSRTFSGALPWLPDEGSPPAPIQPGPWRFFSPAEGLMAEAIVDRLVPADALSAGGKEAGCAVFIDNQLAGPFGQSKTMYMRPPFAKGFPGQGYQGAELPSGRYRAGFAAIEGHCKAAFGGRGFIALNGSEQDQVLRSLEAGDVKLAAQDSKAFFELLLQNTMEGFFADPVYGGNKNMTSWKMLGFPGTRYDYRDHVELHNQRYPLPPVSLMGLR